VKASKENYKTTVKDPRTAH